jgi:hypothetical protein
MNISAKLVRLSLAATTAVLLSAPFASAATIDFTGLSGSNGDSFTTFTESGFKVTSTVGDFDKAISAPGFIGDPLPSIYQTTSFGTVTVTKIGGGIFDFTSVDLANFTRDRYDYLIVGFLGATQKFSTSGSIAGPARTFHTYGTGFSADDINSLTISLDGEEGSANIDNIVLKASATPEPSSLLLLATGLTGLGSFARRRFAQ